MSESREKKKRYNQKLEFISHFEKWAVSEPSMLVFWRWRRWLRERPIWEANHDE